MKSIVCFLLICFCCLSQSATYRSRRGPPPLGTPNPRAALPTWSHQKLPIDHFNAQDTRTYLMRYLYNDQFFRANGPIFIFLGGEWSITTDYLRTGAMYDMAEINGAFMYYIEHRYYGLSFPTDLSKDNLRYLSIDQALEDLAYFITARKKENPEFRESKVVIFGASYSAALATWAKIKYPHLIDIAYASSAPIKAIADFQEYFVEVERNLEIFSPGCSEIIEEGVAAAEELYETESGRNLLSEQFYTCKPLKSDEQYKMYFFAVIGTIFAELVQTAYVGQIKDVCDILNSYPGDSLEKLSTLLKQAYRGACIGDYDDLYAVLTATEATELATRSWEYQACTQFGWFQSASKNIFHSTWRLDYFLRLCKDVLGEEYNITMIEANINRTNIVFGSNTPKISKIIFVNGSADPWHKLGVLESFSEEVVAILVNGTSHCADLISVSENDLDQMKAAKLFVRDVIYKWLQD